MSDSERHPTILGKPPLVEVFCEFFFQTEENQEWDSFLVPEFYKAIKTDYPSRVHLNAVGVQFKLGKADAPAPEPLPPQAPIPRYRFIAADKQRLVQIGRHLLVVNQLPPYYGWRKFKPTLIESFERYRAIWTPTMVSRVALHYIDNVVIPESQFDLAKYFRLFPVLPKTNADAVVTNLAMAFEVQGAEDGDIMAVAFRQTPSSTPESTTFIFQWDYVSTTPREAKKTSVENWLNQAHRFMDDYFHASFTEECWALFKPGGSQ